jgi:Protein of unknown function (DUF3667)
MSQKSYKKLHPYCLNCHYPLSEFDKNCNQCGQKPTDGKTTLHDLMHEFVHTLFHLDGKFFWTLKHLFVPGKLTTEFFKGHHKRYAHPVQLFLVLGALAFGTIVSKTKEAEASINAMIEQKKEKIYKQHMLEDLKKTHLALAPQYSKEQKRVLDTAFVRYKNGQFENDTNSFRIDAIGLNINMNNDKKDKNETKKKETSKSETTNEEDVVTKEETDSIVDDDAHDFIRGVKDGFKKGQKAKKDSTGLGKVITDAVDDAIKAKQINQKNDPYYIYKDSSKLFSFINMGSRGTYDAMKIPDEELLTMEMDSIIKKYKIEGFWNKLDAKQNVKLRRDGGSLFHQYMGKLIWVTLFLIPVLALVFLLVYRRQKKYYVEHVVFLLHYNTTLFVGIILTFWIYPFWNSIVGWFFAWAAIHFFLALKFYYKQGKRKTFLKYSIITSSYFILAMIGLVLTLVISFFSF